MSQTIVLKCENCFESATDRESLDREFDLINNLQNTTVEVPLVPSDLESDNVKALLAQIDGAKKFSNAIKNDEKADETVNIIANKKDELLVSELYKTLSSEKEQKRILRSCEKGEKSKKKKPLFSHTQLEPRGKKDAET